MWAEASRRSPRSDQGRHRHRGFINPSCFPEQFSVWQQRLDFSLRLSGRLGASDPLIRRVMPRESRVFAGCACSSLCSTTREAGLFSGKCSVTLTVTLEKDFMAAHGQLQHPQQRQFHCSLCAIAEPVWHPCLLACLKGGWHLIPSCAVPCHTGFYVLGKTESAAEAAFTLPGGLVVPSVEIITFQAVGAMQAARQNCMSKNSKWDAAASQM